MAGPAQGAVLPLTSLFSSARVLLVSLVLLAESVPPAPL